MSKYQSDEFPHPNPPPMGEGANESRREFSAIWDETRHTLGLDGMDAAHREFIEQVAALVAASDAEFPTLFRALVNHTREHFIAEGRLMRAARYQGMGVHEAEHHRVLGELQQLNRSLMRGRIPLVHAFVKHGLPEWFDNHLSMMDAALVAHLKSLAENQERSYERRGLESGWA